MSSTQYHNSCRGNSVIVCDIRLPLHTVNDPLCEYLLFMDEKAVNCQRSVQSLKQNNIIAIKDAWIITVVKPMSLTFSCPNSESQTIVVNDTFTIINATQCEISNKYFTLPTSYGLHSSYNYSVSTLKISKVKLLAEDETEAVASIHSNLQFSNKIDKLISANHDRISFASFMEEIETEINQSPVKSMHLHLGSFVWSFVLMVCVMLLFWKNRKLMSKLVVKQSTNGPYESVQVRSNA